MEEFIDPMGRKCVKQLMSNGEVECWCDGKRLTTLEYEEIKFNAYVEYYSLP